MRLNILIFSLLVLPIQAWFGPSYLAQAPRSDEAAVRELARKYYLLYETFDFEGQKAMWSPNSVDPAAKSRQTKERAQAMMTTPKIEKLDIWRITLNGDKADVLAKVLLTTFRKDNGKPIGGWYNREVSFRHTFVREANEWNLLGIAFRADDFGREFASAVEPLEKEKILNNYPDVTDREKAESVMNVAGMTGFEKKNVPAALSILDAGAVLAEKANAPELLSRGSRLAAQMYEEQRDHFRAIKAFQEALRFAETTGDKDLRSSIMQQMASVYTRLGDHGQSLLMELKALELEEQLGDAGNVPNAMNSVGASYAILEDHNRAVEYFQKGIDIRNKLPGPKKGNLLLSSLARSYVALGEYDRAKSILDKLLAESETELMNAGANVPPARLSQIKTAIAQVQIVLGDIKLATGDDKGALEIFQKARELTRDSRDNGFTQYLYKRVAEANYRTGEYLAAVEYAEKAVRTASEMGVLDLAWDAMVTQGRAYEALGKTGRSEELYRDAIRIVEDMRNRLQTGEDIQEQFFDGKSSPYRALTSVLIDQDRSPEAFAIAETAKARALLGLIKDGRIGFDGAMSTAERTEEAGLVSTITQLNTELASERQKPGSDGAKLKSIGDRLEKARLELEAFRSRLFIDHPELRIKRAAMTPASLNNIGSLLSSSGSAAVEFVVAESKTFAFVISNDRNNAPKLRSFVIPVKQSDLAASVGSYRKKLAGGELDFQDISASLYKLLLKPLEAELVGKPEIIIVPDGTLWDLPFQTLRDSRGKYLIEKASISYSHSLTALSEMRSRSERRHSPDQGQLLAFGNPIVDTNTKTRVEKVFMGERLEPLPEAERLVAGLSKMYGPTRSKTFIGAAAREQVAKDEAPKFRIIQFATHGILNDVSPMYSHLVLARNEVNAAEDGLLEAWEMKDLKLNADMVILSACDTARGKISNGEGVVGMTWAMFIAGAPTTVASQWKVESSSTTEFMLEFHRQMLGKQKVSKAEALRRASLKLMKMPQYRHPSYWGAWVVVGAS
jgi:CHAT domain-containing protein